MLARLGQVLYWAACALSLICMCAGGAIAQSNSVVTLFGIGGRTCGNWLSSPTTEQEGGIWIVGYWSALDATNGLNVGQRSGPDAILGGKEKLYGRAIEHIG
jgi:hypothetical protein